MSYVRTAAETARLARELSGLLGLGYPLLEALGKLTETCDGVMQQRLIELVEEMRNGDSAGVALGRDPGPFPRLLTQTFQQCEQSGDLPRGLELVAKTLEESSERVAESTLATVYPALVASFLAVALSMLVAFVSSEFDAITQSLLSRPSTVGRLYSQVGAFLRHPLGVIGMILGLGAVWKFFTGTSALRYRLPIYGTWLANSQAVLFLRWTHHLLQLGLPLPEAVRLAAEADLTPLASVYREVSDRVSRGDSLSRALEGAKVFPSVGRWLIAQDEAREAVDLGAVADFLSCELDTSHAKGAAAIEPFTLFLVGLAFLVTLIATQSAVSGVIDGF